MEPGVQSKFRMTERRNVIYRKYLQLVFCIALVLTVLTGCGKNTGQTSRSTEKKEINIPIILTVDPTSGKKTEQDVVDAFNEEYAGTYHMQVEWIMETEEEYRKNLKRLNVTDELPAVIYDVRTLPSFYQMMVADGRIENLSPYLEEDEEWRNMIEPAVMEGCTDEDGNIYLGPISTAAFACAGMFWNPELFAEAGIEKFPETWEEFWDCCDRLQANGITPLGLHTEGTGWAPMLIATAEAAHTEEGYAFMKELFPESYSNDTGLEIAETLQKLFRYTTEDAIHADYDVAYNNFVTGKVAMIPNGYWMIDQLPEEWKEKVRFSAFPGNKLIASPETFGWAVVSTYSEEVKEGAVEFLKFRTKFNLEEKKEQVISSIEEQGKMTEELKEKILLAETLVTVEDLYRPYRPKRRTRATIAKEKGLEPLAAYMMLQQAKEPLEETAKQYISEEKEVKTEEEAIAGAKDIIAEIISDNADYRTWIRKTTMKKGKVVSTAKDPETESVYEMYYEFEESVEKLAGHRILALNRGEKEKILTVKVEAPEEDILRYLEKKTIVNDNPYTTSVLKEVVEDSYKRLIEPAIEREIRNELTEKAEDGAIDVFGKNLHQLLMQPPIAGKVVLGWDPAFRTGCKLAVVDPTGKVIGTTVIYPTAPTTPQKIKASKDLLKKIIPKYHISLISLGNGTASRESEQFIVELLKEIPEQVQYVIVNEAGASVYSASKLASEEFPKFDVGQRSAASIARRLQDPLAELVKIDPKSIGVGQYQHDMNQKKLGEKLGGVVENCVNKVGVDLNTASAPLLSYISGISSAISKNIVAYREEHGKFTSRRELLKVPKLGLKAFEQCAGFMRIRDGENPLDGTGVHPESYEAAKGLLQKQGYSPEDVAAHNLAGLSLTIKDYKATAEELGIGEITLRDIVKELEKPARDPRDEMPKPILRTDVLEMKDLKEGMILKGTVRNVIDFGVFVDIGVHQDGLVHISQITDRYIKHPLEAVSVGDVVDVKVMSVDMKKKRIQLTMRGIS